MELDFKQKCFILSRFSQGICMFGVVYQEHKDIAAKIVNSMKDFEIKAIRENEDYEEILKAILKTKRND